MIADEFGNGAVRARRGGRAAKVFASHPRFGRPAEQRSRKDGSDLGGDQELETVGHGDHAPALADEGFSEVIVRADYFAFKAQVANQVHGPGLGRKKAVGPALDDTAVDPLCLDHAAEARTFFD